MIANRNEMARNTESPADEPPGRVTGLLLPAGIFGKQARYHEEKALDIPMNLLAASSGTA